MRPALIRFVFLGTQFADQGSRCENHNQCEQHFAAVIGQIVPVEHFQHAQNGGRRHKHNCKKQKKAQTCHRFIFEREPPNRKIETRNLSCSRPRTQ